MKVLRAIGHELFSLFVDDWLFALLVVGWVGGLTLAGRGGFVSSRLAGPLLFGGIAVILLAFVARRSARG